MVETTHVNPETRYARSGEISIAYQVLGEAPVDIVVVPGFVGNVEFEWQNARIAAFRRRLARFARIILFDKRGTGLSDGVRGVPTLEERMDDVRAVMDSAGSERAVVLGVSEGGPMTALFAATHPQRVSGAILYGAFSHSRTNASDEHFERVVEEEVERWGTQSLADEELRLFWPSLAHDAELRRWAPIWCRFSATPGAFAALMRMNVGIDVRHVLPAIHVPTLVLHRTGDLVVAVERGRDIAAQVPNAQYVELAGSDHYPWGGDIEELVGPIERFVADVAGEAAYDRVLSTILFTDIVGSTDHAARVGDRAWRAVVEAHHALVRSHLARFRGREIDTAGDGFFATFDGPARAIRCAQSIVEAVGQLGVEVRAGLHCGECELYADKVGGIAVSIGARVAALAAPGEVLVSRTVKDLVAGSEIAFRERGLFGLKGVPGEWPLYAVHRRDNPMR